MKKWISTALAAVMSISLLSGCNGGSQTGFVDEDPNTCPEDTYEINWYLMADPQTDVHSVEEKINDYLKDKINATVKLNCMSSGQYTQKLGTMINANEYFDLAFVARWALDYVGNSRVGAYLKLDDYLDTYLKDITAEYGKENLEYAKVDGGLYALPVYKEMVKQYGWIYRKDIADKYGIDMSKYKTFEELEPVIKMIKENEPDMKYPIDWGTDSDPAALYKETSYVSDNMVFYDGTENAGKAANIYETEGYAKACETAKRYYDNGYIRPDIMTSSTGIQRMKEGKCFVMLFPLKPGKAEEVFKGSAYEFEQVAVMDTKMDYLAGTGSMTAVSASSKNPARVMRFLNLLNTDEYLKNLVIHGIEGKHYTKVDENTVEPIQGSGYDMYTNSWAIGNVFLDKLLTTDAPDKLTSLKEFNHAETSDLDKKVLTFIPEQDDERDRMRTEINNTMGKYTKQIELGVVDSKDVISQLNADLKKVGIDDYLKSIQEEFDEYCK